MDKAQLRETHTGPSSHHWLCCPPFTGSTQTCGAIFQIPSSILAVPCTGHLQPVCSVARSCPILCDPMDCSSPGSSVHGIFQTRILERVVISFCRGSSRPRDRTWVSYDLLALASRFFTIVPPGTWWTSKQPLQSPYSSHLPGPQEEASRNKISLLYTSFQYFGHLMPKNWILGKDSDVGKDWRQEEKGMTEGEMVGWHHWLDGHEFEQALGVGDGQGTLACCSPWGCKESDMTEWLNWTELCPSTQKIIKTTTLIITTPCQPAVVPLPQRKVCI